MRRFHNKIKQYYIDKYITKPSNVLDLASGKGGDLHKWKRNKNIKYVQGYDNDQESINEARKRLNKIKINTPIFFNKKDLNKEILQKHKKNFDIITSFFAFHYFFNNKKTISIITKSIDNNSSTGTILILTLFDGDKIKNIGNVENDLFSLKLNKTNKKVKVYIKDSVLNEPRVENIVSPETLKNTLDKIKFKLIEQVPFKQLYTTLLQDDGLTETEKKLSFLNNVYIFQKY